MSLIVLFLMILLTACSPSSLKEYRDSSQRVVDDITDELHACESKEDLQKKAPRLKKLFQKLVVIMIDAREYQIKHPESEEELEEAHDHTPSDKLLGELNRIYQIEGGRAVVEASQKDALEKLSNFEARR